MKTHVLLFICIISASFLATARADCSDLSMEALIAQSTTLVTDVTTACADLNSANCGDGPCWDAIEQYYAWFQGCYSDIEGLDLTYLVDAIDEVKELLCGALEGLDVLIPNVLSCLNEPGMTDKLQDAALNVYTECVDEVTDSLCSEKCKKAIVSYQELLFKCYDFDANNEDVALEALRGQLETFCELTAPYRACEQVVAAQAIEVREECKPQIEGDDLVVCSGDCYEEINTLTNLAQAECSAFAEGLVHSWNKVCDECGQSAYTAFMAAESTCSDVDWSSVTSCPEECSAAVDDAKQASECFPTSNMIRLATKTIFHLKDEACSTGLDTAGSVCMLREYQPRWGMLVAKCSQDNLCSWECREEIKEFRKTADDCFDGDANGDSLKNAIKSVEKFCTGNDNGNSNPSHLVHLVITNLSAEEILNNLADFFRRIALALDYTVEELILIAIEEYGDSKRSDSISVTLGAESSSDKGTSALKDYGIEASSVESAPADASGGNTSDGSPASALQATAALAVAFVALATLF